MSTWSLRAAMVPITRRVRAYFAPVNRQTETPSIFDPGKHGAFPLDAPPAPWLDLGWIDHFQRSCGTSTEGLQASTRGERGPVSRPAGGGRGIRFPGVGQAADGAGVRIGAHECAGQRSQRKCAAFRRNPGGSGGGAAGIDGERDRLGAGAVDAFTDGDMLAVDADYQQQTGYVGTGIAAAYVNDPADVNRDPNYVRRVTFNLGRVAEKTATSLLLAQPLPGGAPAAGVGAQKVVAFVDREGGSFFQEWSGLFVAEEESGGRVCFFYPRLSPTTWLGSAAAGADFSAKRKWK